VPETEDISRSGVLIVDPEASPMNFRVSFDGVKPDIFNKSDVDIDVVATMDPERSRVCSESETEPPCKLLVASTETSCA